MEMDGLDSAKCQKSRRRATLGIYGIVNDNETKDEQCSSSSNRRKKRQCCSGVLDLESRERKCDFSLDLWPFRPSVLDGARSKAVLRGESYAWTPIWWSSDNSKR